MAAPAPSAIPGGRRIKPALALASACLLSATAYAEFEEVKITRADPIQVQQPCPPSVVAQPQPAAPAPAPQPQQQGGLGVTGKEALGAAAGAAVGGVLGHQVGSGRGQTAATVVGAAAGGYAGYKLAGDAPKPAAPPPPPGQQVICLGTQYRVFYSRGNGLQGDVMMSSMPTSQSLLINFCGDKPCN